MTPADKKCSTGIVGAAIVPHAPQFLTLPDTEDKAQVGRGNTAMRAIGDQFRALGPDLLIVLSNAHCDDFVVHCVPAFMIHCGRRAEGSGGHKGGWPIDGEAGYSLVQQLLDLGFDPAFTLDCRARHRLHDPARVLRLSARDAVPADLRQRLCAATADPGALLRLRPGAGACDRAGRASRGRAGQRRAVALPGDAAIPASRHRHRPGHLRTARRR